MSRRPAGLWTGAGTYGRDARLSDVPFPSPGPGGPEPVPRRPCRFPGMDHAAAPADRPQRGLRRQLEFHIPDLDHVPVAEAGRYHDPLAVHTCPIRATEVSYPPTVLSPGHLGVLARDEAVIDSNRRPWVPADHGHRLQLQPRSGTQTRVPRRFHDQVARGLRGADGLRPPRVRLHLAQDNPDHLEEEEVQEENEHDAEEEQEPLER